MNEQELYQERAWAAGFFDGEGSTCIRKRASGRFSYPSLSIAQSNQSLTKPPEVLLRFQQAVEGMGSITGPYVRPNIKIRWNFRTSGLYVVSFILERLWPWLGEVKKTQAIKVFNNCPTPKRGFYKGMPVPEFLRAI